MKEKIILNRPSGEKEERKVIAHFRVTDDNRPNIKNIPILILDKQEMNNGNNVLEFMWEKDGVYQSINDENAWSEVKSVVVDIIKNNAKTLSYVSDDNVKADIGPGRSLGLTVAQTDPLTANFKTLVGNMASLVDNSVKEETLNDTVDSIDSSINIPPVVGNPTINVNNANPVLNENTVNNQAFAFPNNITSEPLAQSSEPVVEESLNDEVITPFASDAPAIETVINQSPVVETPAPAINVMPDVSISSGPEIIPVEKETDFDKMQQEIEAATREYQEKIKSIVDAYKKKITEAINEANNLKEQATDHLKNAQAREQIANMAYQNSMELNNAPSLQKIA